MTRFEIFGIKSPGRIRIPGKGLIVLEDLSDDQAEKLYDAGLKYLRKKKVSSPPMAQSKKYPGKSTGASPQS